jgi:hypothetical protein
VHRFHPDQLIAGASSLDDLAAALETLLSGGYSVWTDGRLIQIKALVGRVSGLRIVVYPREHPPPHFHVVAPGLNASFSILDGSPLEGELDAARLRLIQYWFRRSRPKLIAAWNAARPTDCPVGPIVE